MTRGIFYKNNNSNNNTFKICSFRYVEIQKRLLHVTTEHQLSGAIVK